MLDFRTKFIEELKNSRNSNGSYVEDNAISNFITYLKMERGKTVYTKRMSGGLKNSLHVDMKHFLEFFRSNPKISHLNLTPLVIENSLYEDREFGKDYYPPTHDDCEYVFSECEDDFVLIHLARRCVTLKDENGEVIDRISLSITSLTAKSSEDIASEFESEFGHPLAHILRGVKNKTKGSMHTLVPASGGRLQIREVGVTGADFVKDNYPPSVGDKFEALAKSISSSSPRGRLNILTGPPGTGKTFFLRGLLNTCKDCIFIVLNPSYIGDIQSPSLISCFLDYRSDESKSKIVLIIEDSDMCLVRRHDGNVSMISSLLNITDGLIGELLDFRIIATTNAHRPDFDPAIERPGRLDQIIDFTMLDRDHAERLYSKITGGRTDLPPTPMEKENTAIGGFHKHKAPVNPTSMSLAQVYFFASEYLVKEPNATPPDYSELEKIGTERARIQIYAEKEKFFKQENGECDDDDDDFYDD